MSGVRSPPRKSFASRNLNSATRKPEQSRPQRAYGGGGRLLVLGKRPEPTAASKATGVMAPVPMNTPSMRKESGGQDVTVKLVPSGGGGWEKPPPEPEPEVRRLAPPKSQAAIAPWAKQAIVDAAKPPEERSWAPVEEPPAQQPQPWARSQEQQPPAPPASPPQHQWRRSADADRRVEQSVAPPPPPASPPQKRDEPPDKLPEESQSDYMKRIAQLRASKRRAEEQADEEARRARASERLARLDAQRRAAHPLAAPVRSEPPRQQQQLQPEEDNRWQRGARVPGPPEVEPPVVPRERVKDAGVPLERAATRDGRSFASMFAPTENPDQLKVSDGYDRHPNREKPKLFDPKSGSYVDPSSRPSPPQKPRSTRGLRLIDDSKPAPSKEAPQVRLLARPAPAVAPSAKAPEKKKEPLPKDLSNADATTIARLKEERAIEKAARQPRTRGFLYKHENGDVVLADGQPSRRSKRGRGGRKRAEAATKAEPERSLAPGAPVRSTSAGSVCLPASLFLHRSGVMIHQIKDHHLSSLITDYTFSTHSLTAHSPAARETPRRVISRSRVTRTQVGPTRAPGPRLPQPPGPSQGLGVFGGSQEPSGGLAYAPFGGFNSAPPPQQSVSALGGAEFIPCTASAASFGRTASAGSFGGIGIVQDDLQRHDGVSTLGGAEFVPGAGLVPTQPELSGSFDPGASPEFNPADAPEFVPGGAFGSGLLGVPSAPQQNKPQGSGLLWDR